MRRIVRESLQYLTYGQQRRSRLCSWSSCVHSSKPDSAVSCDSIYRTFSISASFVERNGRTAASQPLAATVAPPLTGRHLWASRPHPSRRPSCRKHHSSEQMQITARAIRHCHCQGSRRARRWRILLTSGFCSMFQSPHVCNALQA